MTTIEHIENKISRSTRTLYRIQVAILVGLIAALLNYSLLGWWVTGIILLIVLALCIYTSLGYSQIRWVEQMKGEGPAYEHRMFLRTYYFCCCITPIIGVILWLASYDRVVAIAKEIPRIHRWQRQDGIIARRS